MSGGRGTGGSVATRAGGHLDATASKTWPLRLAMPGDLTSGFLHVPPVMVSAVKFHHCLALRDAILPGAK